MNSPTINRWWTVLSGFIGTAMGVGIFVVFVLSGLTKPMAADLGFDRSVISFSLTCFLISTGVGTVTLGVLMHRFGVGRPAFIFLAFTALLVSLIPALPATPIAFYILFSLLGIAGAASTTFPYSVAITGLFDRNRGFALALAVTGGAVGAILGPQLSQGLLDEYGWRTTIRVMATLIGLPLITLTLFVRSPPNLVARSGTADPTATHSPPFFLRSPSFWLIAMAVLAIAAGGFVLASLVPLLTDKGISPQIAARILSAAGTASLLGRIGVGWLMDRIWGPFIAASVCFAACVGLLLVANCGQAIVPAYIGAILIGFGLGAEGDIVIYLCGRYFSKKVFTRVVGSMWLVWAWGGSLGTAAAGTAYKLTGSYQSGLWLLSGVLIAAAVGVLMLGPYRYPPGYIEPTEDEAETLLAAAQK